jgi:hypothetical protein
VHGDEPFAAALADDAHPVGGDILDGEGSDLGTAPSRVISRSRADSRRRRPPSSASRSLSSRAATSLSSWCARSQS